tara:strand:+ start:10005 stop:10334 length:330 start_codon:yes stop_codon:yes gene_type:complete
MIETYYADVPVNHFGDVQFVKINAESYELAETFLTQYTAESFQVDLYSCELHEANEWEKDFKYKCLKGCEIGHHITIRNEAGFFLAEFHNLLNESDFTTIETDKELEYV